MSCFGGCPRFSSILGVNLPSICCAPGIFPLWNSLNGAGAPLFANYQSSLLYPFSWIGFVLPLAQTMSLVAVLHLLIAGWGMERFTHRLGASTLGSGVSALAFGLSAYLVARTGTYPIIQTVAWLPWLLWAALRLLDNGRPRSGGLLAIFAALLLLAGHAQTAWYSLLLVGGFALWWTLTHRPFRWRRLIGVAGCLLIGAGIAGLQLIATAELLAQSQRAGGVDFDFAMNYSYAPASVLNLFAPNVFGTPADASYLLPRAFFEDAVYVGVIPLIAALAAVIGRIVRWRDPDRPADLRDDLLLVDRRDRRLRLCARRQYADLSLPLSQRADFQPVSSAGALASMDGHRLERTRRDRRDRLGARGSPASLDGALDLRLFDRGSAGG